MLIQGKVEQILDFDPSRLNESKNLHNVPILLSFLCVLVREDGIVDLSDRSISVGEIYWRMVRCLYKKFVLRKEKKFDMNSFVGVLKSLGKLALETWFKSPFFQRSQVVEAAGEEAFDYGLLLCYCGQSKQSLTKCNVFPISKCPALPHTPLKVNPVKCN